MHRRVACGVLMLCLMVFVCLGAACSTGPKEGEDVDCEIGIISEGNDYTAMIKLEDSSWAQLTEVQKDNVVAQCVDTLALSRMEDAQDDPYVLTGYDKKTKKRLFVYSGKSQETTYTQ